MNSPFSAIAIVAENRIAEAIANGDFDNLPGAGKPLPPDDLAGVPEDLRLAYKILKNSGHLPPELERRKEAASLVDLLDNSPDEQTRVKAMKKLRFLIERRDLSRNAELEANDLYYQKILARLEREERKTLGQS